MADMDEPRTLMVAFDRKVYHCGIFLHLLMYDAPGLQEALRTEPALRVRVFMNRFDVSQAIARLPDGTIEELTVGRPDYAAGRSLENHLKNVERLKEFNRSGSRDRNAFRVLPKDGYEDGTR
jgi:hypothetical protein